MLSGVTNEAGCQDACSECNARNDAQCDSRWRIQVHCVFTHLYILAGYSNLTSLYSVAARGTMVNIAHTSTCAASVSQFLLSNYWYTSTDMLAEMTGIYVICV